MVDNLVAGTFRLVLDHYRGPYDRTDVVASYDPQRGAATVSVSKTSGEHNLKKLQVVRIGDDLYARHDNEYEEDWVLFDDAGETPPHGLMELIAVDDPAGVRTLLASATDLTYTDDEGYRGRLDLTSSPALHQDLLPLLGEAAESVPTTSPGPCTWIAGSSTRGHLKHPTRPMGRPGPHG